MSEGRVLPWFMFFLSLATTGIAVQSCAQRDQEIAQKKSELALAQKQLGVAERQLTAAEGQLAAKQAELQKLQAEAIDPTTVTLESIRQLLKTAENDGVRALYLQSFARKIREGSKVDAAGVNDFGGALSSGTMESARLLSGQLRKYPGIAVDLSLVDLHGHYSKNSYLRLAVLNYADLRAVDLSESKLMGASLIGAHLACANLENAELKHGDFEGADLAHANLRGADLATGKNLTMKQLQLTTYDARTRFPENVNRYQLPASQRYAGADHCARTYLMGSRDTSMDNRTGASQGASESSSSSSKSPGTS